MQDRHWSAASFFQWSVTGREANDKRSLCVTSCPLHYPNQYRTFPFVGFSMIRWFFLRLCQSRHILALNFWNLLSEILNCCQKHVTSFDVTWRMASFPSLCCSLLGAKVWTVGIGAVMARPMEGNRKDGFPMVFKAHHLITSSKDINRFQGLQLRRKRCTEQVAEVRRMKWIHIISENPDICEYNPEVVSAVIPVYLYKLMRHHINATCLEQKSESQSWNPFLGIWTLHFAKKGMWTILSHIIRVPKGYGQRFNQAAPMDSFMQLPQCHGKKKLCGKKKRAFRTSCIFSRAFFKRQRVSASTPDRFR